MAAIPQPLQDAFQAAFDATNDLAALQTQYATLQAQIATLTDQIRAASLKQAAAEQNVVTLTAQLLGPNTIAPTPPTP